MKKVTAYVQPSMAGKVTQALHRVPWLSGASFTEARGFGRGRTNGVLLATEEELTGTVPKVRVEVVVPDELEDVVVQAIQGAARTGNRGDGKIYVTPVHRAVRISTGEEGESGPPCQYE